MQMNEPPDDVDLALLALLQADARRTVADMASRVALSPTAVKRRIDRLERTGIISGYTARVDHARLGWAISAFIELRFEGTTKPEEMDRRISDVAEVVAVYTTAGDQDVIALVRARSVDHLRQIIHRIRAATAVMSTRTHVILDAHVKEDWSPS